MEITKDKLQKYKKGLPKRLVSDGKVVECETYLIPIEMLYFNNLNGRIGTYIDEYNDQNNEDLDHLRQEDIKRYNDLIANFIKKSSNDGQKSYIATRDDIKEKGQQVPGVVLSDGRIIDGNRRFTAIRELYEKTGDPRFAYFEAAVLPCPEKTDLEGWKEIRRKELWLQYNVNEKKEYNLIPFYF